MTRASAIRSTWLSIAFAIGALLLLSSCDSEQTPGPSFTDNPSAPPKSEYGFGVVPLHNPERLFEIYGPLTAYLSARVPGAQFRLEASRDYPDFESKLYKRILPFAFANPYEIVRALDHGYHVFAKMGDDQDFRALIVVRRDSGVEQVADLKGKAVSFLSATTIGTTMLPQYYLHTHGLDVNKDIRSLYVGTHESSLMNVYHRFTAAGATRPGPWQAFQRQHPEEAKELMVKWETESLPHIGLIARDDVPQPVVNAVASLMFSLQDNEEGRKILAAIPISHFAPATNATYEPARAFLRRFSAEVRPLEGIP